MPPGRPGSIRAVNPILVRNLAIVLGIAALVFVSDVVFGSVAGSVNLIISVLFVIAIGYAAWRYFRSNDLAWFVIPAWQRKVLIACGIAVLALILVGFPLLGPVISPLGVIALIAALVLVIIWIVRESRRF